MCARYTSALSVFQESLIHQYVADRGNRNTASDIICQKQDDLAQQDWIRDTLLTPAAFTFQNIPYNNRGICF